jgi:hypothetical protein
MDVDDAQFSKAELVEMYPGWMLCFIGKDLLELKKSGAEKGKQKFMELLKMRFKKAVKVEVNAEAFMLEKSFFLAFVYFEDGSKKGFVADEDGLYQRIFKHVKFESGSLMLYRFLGWQFNPLDMS